jgi:hypothetical protein
VAGLSANRLRGRVREAPLKPLPWPVVALLLVAFLACLAGVVLIANYGMCNLMYWDNPEPIFHASRTELCGRPPFGR